MNNYRLFTDSGCDLGRELLEELGITEMPLTFRFNGDSKEYTPADMPVSDFYAKMRAGGVAKTAAANTAICTEFFKKALDEGDDVLCISFSSGLSTTYNSARLSALALSEKYPDRKIIVIDTLAASSGQGLLCYFAAMKKNEGLSIEDCAEHVRSLLPKLCHWFTVEDLVYLKRGGRVSSTAAFVGNLLAIKPVLHVDDEGHLINVTKVRGRKPSLIALADKYGELADCDKDTPVFISQADSLADAQFVAQQLKDKYGATNVRILDIGPVIGAHAGPGTIALFFIGKNR